MNMNTETKKLAAAFAVVMVLVSLVFGFGLWKVSDMYQAKIVELQSKINLVAQHSSKAPKIIALDIGRAASQWAGHNDEVAIKAVEATIKYYNEQGYLIIDSASLVGDISKYQGEVPTPEKMRQLMKDNSK